jgi:hypothetical protein
MLVGNNNNEAGLSSTLSRSRGVPVNETANLFTNLGYNCGAKTAAIRRINNNIPVWRYRWMGEFPNQRIAANAGA